MKLRCLAGTRRSHLHHVSLLVLAVGSLWGAIGSIRGGEATDDQLRSAAYDGDAKAVQVLLSREPSEVAVNRGLYDATSMGHRRIAIALMKHGADVNFADGPHHDMPLMNAAAINDVATMRACLRHGADPNLKCDYGWTALIHAAFQGHLEAVKLLTMHRGTHINARDRYDFTALTAAVSQGRVAVVRYLLTTPADPAMKTDRGETAMGIARANANDPAASGELRKHSRVVLRMLRSRLR